MPTPRTTRDRLLRHLNDRCFVTGTELGLELGISRAAVHNHIDTLKASGLPVEGIMGRGYRLARGVKPMDGRFIEEQLEGECRRHVSRIIIEHCVDSTNDIVSKLARKELIHGVVCITEAQPAGRGRRGKHWVATPFRNLLMSLGWMYESWPPDLTGLSVAAGIALIEAMSGMGIAGLGMKWPNDIVFDGKKLGGILIDITGESSGQCTIVIGVGINVHIDDNDDPLIDQPWTDLTRVLGRAVDRNELAASCLSGLCRLLCEFPGTGFEPYCKRWTEVDVLTGKVVSITTHEKGGTIVGVVLGLDTTGALAVAVEGGGKQSFFSGDVSVKAR